MKKSFFLKRGLEFKLRLENQIEKQYAELALGVSGEIDPLSGMIMNLSELSQIFENFRDQISNETFSDTLEFLEKARAQLRKISVLEIFHHSLGRNYSLRFENEKYLLHLSDYIQSEKFHIETEIHNSAELLTALRWQHQAPTFQNISEVKEAFSHIAKKFTLKREELISGRTFLEN